jgi:hypothetical protein
MRCVRTRCTVMQHWRPVRRVTKSDVFAVLRDAVSRRHVECAVWLCAVRGVILRDTVWPSSGRHAECACVTLCSTRSDSAWYCVTVGVTASRRMRRVTLCSARSDSAWYCVTVILRNTVWRRGAVRMAWLRAVCVTLCGDVTLYAQRKNCHTVWQCFRFSPFSSDLCKIFPATDITILLSIFGTRTFR